MQRMLDRMANGVEANWKALTARSFIRDYLFCVGSIQKPYKRRIDNSAPGFALHRAPHSFV